MCNSHVFCKWDSDEWRSYWSVELRYCDPDGSKLLKLQFQKSCNLFICPIKLHLHVCGCEKSYRKLLFIQLCFISRFISGLIVQDIFNSEQLYILFNSLKIVSHSTPLAFACELHNLVHLVGIQRGVNHKKVQQLLVICLHIVERNGTAAMWLWQKALFFRLIDT